MRRTQLYLDDQLWDLLHLKAKQAGTTISDLVRQAVREKYASQTEARKETLRSLMGLWKDRTDLPETEVYIRQLRKDTRRKRMFS